MKKPVIFSVILVFLSFSTLEAPLLANETGLNSADTNAMAGYPASSEISEDPIHIIHPEENAKLPALSSTFVCGSVPMGGKLFINSLPVTVHPGGGFLTMVPLAPGEFKIKADWQFGTTTFRSIRTIFVTPPEKPAPVSPLTIESVSPHLDQALLPQDAVEISCKGSPGMIAYFTVQGIWRRFPMSEDATMPGVYHGILPLRKYPRLEKAQIRITLVNQRRHKTSQAALGRVSVFPHVYPVMAQVVSSNTVLRAGPAISSYNKAGYLMFPPEGTLLQITGRIGNEYRVRLSPSQTVWVSVSQVKLLPRGTPSSRVVVGSISIYSANNSTLIRVPLARKIPFLINPDMDGDYLDLSLYGAYSNTDIVSREATGAVSNIRWFQDNTNTYRLRIYTPVGSWWGYDARFEGSDTNPELVLELRNPPPVTVDSSPLAGLTIALDAGHGAGRGAIGATGYAEGDANLSMALNLEAKLLAKGAHVIMTRPGDEDVPLNTRTRLAWEARANLLLSLHNNSHGYSGNPLLNHGFGVYYFTPMSFPLAKAVHHAYQKAFLADKSRFNLPDNGLYYDNLALTRPTQMPSILIESAFMIVPKEEAYLKTEAFRSACSDAIIQGLEDYVRLIRLKTNPSK